MATTRAPILARLACLAIPWVGGGCGEGDSASTETGSTAGTSDATEGSTASPTGTAGSASSGSTAATSTTGATSQTTSATGTTGEPTDPPEVLLPRVGLVPAEVGVVVNDADPSSQAVADAFVAARGIPAENVVHVSLPVQAVADPADFAAAKAETDALPDTVQALVLAWTQPYRAGCQSIASAFALGYDEAYCGGMNGCGTTPASPYFDHPTTRPWTDLGIRPTMMLAGVSTDAVLATIDRGVAADGTAPPGDGYLVRTTDAARSVRWPVFEQTVDLFDHPGGLALTYVDNADGMGSNTIEDAQDVMFYFTGLANVPGIDTNTYRPGALADHLTSFAGQVPTAGGQMSAAAWLEAGVTASYGSVTEPCNYVEKFPNTKVLLAHYFRGATAIEAYWKSVEWPGQGNFVGEPLAAPYRATVVDWDPATHLLSITTTLLEPGADYVIESADAETGPWTEVLSGSVPYPVEITLEVPDATAPFYRLRKSAP
ncbi:MAG: TIGR03790 family protein [Deltaproteobacteria bacterium]|nr:MAG: TIGR03790 family protein [Deltaproteobacteria bacterium]